VVDDKIYKGTLISNCESIKIHGKPIRIKLFMLIIFGFTVTHLKVATCGDNLKQPASSKTLQVAQHDNEDLGNASNVNLLGNNIYCLLFIH
jgi:hypothetical protein